MGRVAIDVVLLLSEDIQEICFEINRRAFENGKGRFRLGEDDFVPHISLGMGCVEEQDLDDVVERIERAVKEQWVLSLEVEKIGMFCLEGGDRGYLKVGVSDELRELHRKILREVSSYLVGCDSADVLVGGKESGMGKFTEGILNNYEDGYAYDNYNAHVSLGCLDSDEFGEGVVFPIGFVTERIAVFRVGDGCTCRELVWSGGLKLR